MTDFGSVQSSPHQPVEFALHSNPIGVPMGGLCCSTRLSSPPPEDTAYATSAWRVLRVLPGLLYTTAYPGPLKLYANSMPKRVLRKPIAGAAAPLALRNPLAGHSSSMTHSRV